MRCSRHSFHPIDCFTLRISVAASNEAIAQPGYARDHEHFLSLLCRAMPCPAMDQAGQFIGPVWITTLTEAEVRISMYSRGR